MGRQLTLEMIPGSLDEQLKSDYSGYHLTGLYQIETEESGDYLLVFRKGDAELRLRNNEQNKLVIVKKYNSCN